jgi:hypothetical protein
MLSKNEPDETPTRTEFQAAYFAGKQAVLGLPRWGFYLLIILAVVVGDVVEKSLVSRYSLPEPEAFLLSFIPVILLGLLTEVVIRRLSRREIH